MTVIKKTRNNILVRMWRKWNPYWWECKLVQSLWKTVWRFLKKLKVELLYDSASPLLGEYMKEINTKYQRDLCTPMCTAAKFTIAKIRNNHVSIFRWISLKKIWYVCIYITHTMEYYSTIKEKEILPFATIWMKLEVIMLTEISQTKKTKYYLISCICGIWKKEIHKYIE